MNSKKKTHKNASSMRIKSIYTNNLLGYNIVKYYISEENEMEKINEKNNLYEQFLKYSYNDLKELFKKAKTKEEQDFYIALSDLVLQKEQERVVGKN